MTENVIPTKRKRSNVKLRTTTAKRNRTVERGRVAERKGVGTRLIARQNVVFLRS